MRISFAIERSLAAEDGLDFFDPAFLFGLALPGGLFLLPLGEGELDPLQGLASTVSPPQVPSGAVPPDPPAGPTLMGARRASGSPERHPVQQNPDIPPEG